MNRHLSLVQSDFEALEKRRLPRFPFCYLLFKNNIKDSQVFEIKDISRSGMQLSLKNGDLAYKENDVINGEIHWLGRSVDISGEIVWVKQNRLGVEFSTKPSQRENVDDFLDIDHFASSLKPLHQGEFGLELPTKLKYWLRSDGPVEVFVWRHSDGELSKFQILIMENFIEWEDTKGLKTGRVISKRNIDTPLISEDEFVFKLDPIIDDVKIDHAKQLISGVGEDKCPAETLSFIKMKLGQ